MSRRAALMGSSRRPLGRPTACFPRKRAFDGGIPPNPQAVTQRQESQILRHNANTARDGIAPSTSRSSGFT